MTITQLFGDRPALHKPMKMAPAHCSPKALLLDYYNLSRLPEALRKVICLGHALAGLGRASAVGL